MISRIFVRAAAVLWLLGIGPVLADTPPPQVIGVFGDSLGYGVWSGLYTIMKKHPDDKLFRYAKVGAGLTRPDYAAWFAEFTQSLDTDKTTEAVVMVGANDQQSIRDENHKGYLFQSDGWKRAYISRIDAMLDEFAKRHIAVVWVGLPIMAKDDMNAGALYLNGIFADEVQRRGSTFLPLIDTYKGADGHFAAYLPDPAGHLKQVRGDDGVHFTGYGYELVAEKVYDALQTAKPAAVDPAPAP